MGTPGLPNLALSQLASRLAQAKGSAGMPGVQAGAPPGSDAGSAVSKQLSELKGADPKQGEAYIQEMVSKLASLINTYALRIPGAAQSLARALPSLQRALKEIQTASQTLSAAGGPINMSVAAGQPAESGGNPGPAGGMNQSVGPIFPT